MIEDRVQSARFIANADLPNLGQSLAKAWPVETCANFERLLEQIDDGDLSVGQARDYEQVRGHGDE